MRKTLTRPTPALAAALTGLGAAVLAAGSAAAHHSFAVFFDDGRTITVTGEVTEFHFRNPHGTISLVTTEAEGQEAGLAWKAETNAPVILRRRGWSADSLEAGDRITITGWPARDGSNYMRMQTVTDRNGAMIGTAAFAPDDN